jgi:hypothetical protein
MEHFKRFEFFIDDLTDEAKARFISFLDGDEGNHDIIPFCTYETVCEDGDCEGCEWKCTRSDGEDEDD